MKIQYFPETDTLSIRLNDKPSIESEEIAPDVVVDRFVPRLKNASIFSLRVLRRSLGDFTSTIKSGARVSELGRMNPALEPVTRPKLRGRTQFANCRPTSKATSSDSYPDGLVIITSPFTSSMRCSGNWS